MKTVKLQGIPLKIHGADFKISIDEARELYLELSKLFNGQTFYPIHDDFDYETDELRPCPFCDSKANIDDDVTGIRTVTYWVSCSNCGVETLPTTDKQAAIKAWNTRKWII